MPYFGGIVFAVMGVGVAKNCFQSGLVRSLSDQPEPNSHLLYHSLSPQAQAGHPESGRSFEISNWNLIQARFLELISDLLATLRVPFCQFENYRKLVLVIFFEKPFQ